MKKLFFILLISGSCHGQVTEPKELINVLKDIETSHKVRFSYQPDQIKNILVKVITANLESSILQIEKQTQFKIIKINDRYYGLKITNKVHICGTVRDLKTGKPLASATVNEVGSLNGTITDQQGNYSLDIKKGNLVFISYLGYESLRISPDKNSANCQTDFLKPISFALNAVVLNNILTQGISLASDGTTQINVKNFGTLPGLSSPDVLQTIQALPGIESVDESISNINVRGGSNDENLILWDGIKMYHTGHFFGLISAYNPFLTEHITIYKNGTTAKYGDGVSSSIIMETSDELHDHVSGNAGVDLLSADATVFIPISKKLETHLSVRRSYNELLETPTYDNYFTRSFQGTEVATNSENLNNIDTSSRFSFHDLSAKVLYDINENNKLRISSIYINNDLDYIEGFEVGNEQQSFNSKLSQENFGLSASYSTKLSPLFRMNATGYYSRYTVEAIDFRIDSDQRLEQFNEVLEGGFKVDMSYQFKKQKRDGLVVSSGTDFSLNIGYQINETGTLNFTRVNNPDFRRNIKDVLINHATWTEFEISSKKWFARAGVRYNYFQDFNQFRLEPRINVRHKISSSLALIARGELKSQTVTQIIDFDNDFLGVENRRWTVANNESIPIVTSAQASMGAQIKIPSVTIVVNGFYKEVDGISAHSQGFLSSSISPESIGSYNATGAEALIQKQINNLSGWLSYSYSINNYTFEDVTPSTFPVNSDVRHSLQASISYSFYNKLQLSLGAQYRNGIPFTAPDPNMPTRTIGNLTTINYGPINQERLDDFFRLDASIKYNFEISERSNGSLHLGLRNLTGKQNTIARFYRVSTIDGTIREIDDFSLNFTPNLSFRVTF